MAAKNPAQLAGLLNLSSMDKGGPLGAACALGAIDGYPVAVAWNRRAKPGAAGVRHDGTQGRPTVTFLVRFKKGSLSVAPAEFGGKIATSSRLLEAMGLKGGAGSGKNAVTVAPDAVFFFWDYTLRAPKPEAAAGVLRALVDIVKASRRTRRARRIRLWGRRPGSARLPEGPSCGAASPTPCTGSSCTAGS